MGGHVGELIELGVRFFRGGERAANIVARGCCVAERVCKLLIQEAELLAAPGCLGTRRLLGSQLLRLLFRALKPRRRAIWPAVERLKARLA